MGTNAPTYKANPDNTLFAGVGSWTDTDTQGPLRTAGFDISERGETDIDILREILRSDAVMFPENHELTIEDSNIARWDETHQHNKTSTQTPESTPDERGLLPLERWFRTSAKDDPFSALALKMHDSGRPRKQKL